MRNYTPKRQAGMTLIELTVVLFVLVGLAGLLIPYVSGFAAKTHDATGSTNMARAGESIIRFETEKGRYPDTLDSLLVGAGAPATAALINYTMMGATAAATYALSVTDLTAAANAQVCASLMKAGLDRVVDMDDGTKAGFNPTFSNGNAVTPVVAIGDTMMGTCSGAAVEITSAKVAEAFSLPASATANKRYVMFGLGGQNEAIGKTMQEAPVHFTANSQFAASSAYNRFGVIFEVDNNSLANNTAADAVAAKYVGTAMLMMDVIGMQEELANYYKTAAAND